MYDTDKCHFLAHECCVRSWHFFCFFTSCSPLESASIGVIHSWCVLVFVSWPSLFSGFVLSFSSKDHYEKMSQSQYIILYSVAIELAMAISMTLYAAFFFQMSLTWRLFSIFFYWTFLVWVIVTAIFTLVNYNVCWIVGGRNDKEDYGWAGGYPYHAAWSEPAWNRPHVAYQQSTLYRSSKKQCLRMLSKKKVR